MSKEKGIFINYLKKRDLKLTGQREKILDIFLKTDKHLSVEDLYSIVKRKDPRIGQATVFRTLKLLCEAQLAKVVDFGDKKVRYEHSYGHRHHDHLICNKCGKSIEVMNSKIEKLQEGLCKEKDFLVERHSLEIFGICKNCR